MNSPEEVQISVKPELCTGCLVCQLNCSFKYNQIFNPAQARLRVLMTPKKGMSYQVSYKDDCVKCGTCARSCVFGALTLEGGEN